MLKEVIYPGWTFAQPHGWPQVPRDEVLYVADDGTLYERSGGFLRPADGAPRCLNDNGQVVGGTLQPGHKVNLSAPWRCPGCGTDRLRVYYDGGYSLVEAECPDCDIRGTVASVE